MFSEKLTTTQQAVFLDLLDQLIMADGVRTQNEDLKFEDFQKAFPNIIPEHVSDEKLQEIFTSRRESVGVMLELLSVALIEGELNSFDKFFLEKLCSSLALSECDFGWMQLWVKNMLFLVRQTESFMEA